MYIYVYLYTYLHSNTYICMHAHTHVHTHMQHDWLCVCVTRGVCIGMSIYVCMYINICPFMTWLILCVYVYPHIYVCMYIHFHLWHDSLCVYVCLYMYVCMYVYIYMPIYDMTRSWAAYSQRPDRSWAGRPWLFQITRVNESCRMHEWGMMHSCVGNDSFTLVKWLVYHDV